MISNIKAVLYRVNPLVAAATLILAALIPVLAAQRTQALGLTNRSLMVSSTVASNDLAAPDGSTYVLTGPSQLLPGDPRNGAQVDHEYVFTVATTGTIEGFTIEYCTSAFDYVGTGACTGPSGFSAAAWGDSPATVTIGGELFNIVDNAANFLTLTADDDGIPVTAGDPVTMTFTADETNFFANPNIAYRTGPSNGTYFAHISTFAVAADATAAFADSSGPIDGLVDEGTVTNNVTQSISIYTRVQETLNFSVEGEGGTGDVDGVPTSVGSGCDPLIAPSLITMGDTDSVLSPTQEYFANSYFRLATNSANGTSVYYSGDTLRSSAYALTALTDAAPVASDDGNEQFGLAIDVAASTLNELDNVTAAYAAGEDNEFAFNTGSVATPIELAYSDDVVACDTGHVKYVANIATDTPAGIYTTKINYIASPSY